MKLKLGSKFTLFIVTVFLSLTIAAWYLSNKIISDVNTQWANQFSVRQVQFDTRRTLMPLIKEIALARQLAVEPAIIEMVNDEGNIEAKNRAFETLDQYRKNFRDKNYFLATVANGNYYYNDSKNTYAGRELRYQLSPENKQDQWFYATIKSGIPYQINLNHDAHLNATKAWINVLVENAGKPIGMIGTGIDITAFLRETVDIGQEGILNIFINRDMAVQLYRNANLIDYAGITKSANDRSRIDAILKDPKDLVLLQETMNKLEKFPHQIETITVNFEGKPRLLGVAYLPDIGWFDLTLMDSKGILIANEFFIVPIVITILFLLVLVSLWIFLNRTVIKPIAALNQAALQIEQGNFSLPEKMKSDGDDEIGQVTLAFRKMTLSLKEYTSNLQNMVADRTAELESASLQLKILNEDLNKLSRTDQLTQVRNRRDLQDCLQIEENRAKRSGLPCGILMLDIDNFKQVNDRYGHHAGDEILKKVASAMLGKLRAEDILGRWGGEEFLILLPGTSLSLAQDIAEKIRSLIELTNIQLGMGNVLVTVSLGVSIFTPAISTEIDYCVKEADQALYKAKEHGRNTVVVFTNPNG